MGLTRDSALLWLAAAGALFGYLQIQGAPTGWTFDQWMAFGIAVTGYAIGKLQHSPLKGASDGAKVGPRAWFLPLVLVSGLAVTGCLPKSVNVPAPVNPAPTEQQIQAVRDKAEVLAKAVREASALAVQAGRAADVAYDAGLIPPATMQRINQAGIEAADTGAVFIAFARTVTTEPSLQVTVRELLRIFDGYIDALTEGKQSGAAIRTALDALRAYLGGE